MPKYKYVFTALAAATVGSGAVYFTQYHLNDPANYQPVKLISGNRSTLTLKYQNKIIASQNAVKRFQNQLGVPGVVVGVSVDGKIVWNEGFGMANVETQTLCNSETKMRIASISKPITMTLLAKLVETGLVDLDRPVQEYVPYFPKKTVDKKNVMITPRLLACHMAGVRHYKKSDDSDNDGGPEFYLKERFKELEKSVDLFKDDDLEHAPGDKFLYTTHGFTLLSAVIEGAAKKPFEVKLRNYLKELGLSNTHLDEIPTIVYGRASYYARDKKGRLTNAELTDNSYKWAGGGLVSNTGDLLKFASIMLISYQNNDAKYNSYLKAETVKELWTPQPGTEMSWGIDSGYGLGWTVVPEKAGWAGNDGQTFHVGHGGGAVGASSILLIIPGAVEKNDTPPKGIAVAIIGNLQDVSFYKLAMEIANNFKEA